MSTAGVHSALRVPAEAETPFLVTATQLSIPRLTSVSPQFANAGQTLTLECKNPMGHHRLAYDFSEKGTLRSRMESNQDGKEWSPMFDGVYHQG